MAIRTRWSMPPESWCGHFFSCCSGGDGPLQQPDGRLDGAFALEEAAPRPDGLGELLPISAGLRAVMSPADQARVFGTAIASGSAIAHAVDPTDPEITVASVRQGDAIAVVDFRNRPIDDGDRFAVDRS
jgi:hypothetical protein